MTHTECWPSITEIGWIGGCLQIPVGCRWQTDVDDWSLSHGVLVCNGTTGLIPGYKTFGMCEGSAPLICLSKCLPTVVSHCLNNACSPFWKSLQGVLPCKALLEFQSHNMQTFHCWVCEEEDVTITASKMANVKALRDCIIAFRFHRLYDVMASNLKL